MICIMYHDDATSINSFSGRLYVMRNNNYSEKNNCSLLLGAQVLIFHQFYRFMEPPNDYVSQPPEPNQEHDKQSSDTDTATNTLDEFDWDEEDDNPKVTNLTKAKRGRKLWLAFMRLARPIRVLLVSTIGAAFFITPLLVVDLRFKSSPVRNQIHVWSLWLTIVWAASCGTHLLIDAIPRLVLGFSTIFGGHVERLKTQLEVCI